MNSLFMENNDKLVIIDNEEDTSVIGQGCEVVTVRLTRKAHVVEFDYKVAIKRKLDIACAYTLLR